MGFLQDFALITQTKPQLIHIILIQDIISSDLLISIFVEDYHLVHKNTLFSPLTPFHVFCSVLDNNTS